MGERRAVTTTGVVGGRWRASVTDWGAVEPWDGSTAIDWFVAADDRWHTPQHETSTRQIHVSGTPVVETRVRIPGGDVVHRVYSVADAGGMTIIEVVNDSSLPIAVAFTGGRLLTRRPPTLVPPQGIDLPADAVMHPIGHRASVMVARAHGAAAAAGSGATLPESVPSADQVVHGWLTQTQRASRLQLPDAALVEAVTAARCALLLDGPGQSADSGDQGDQGDQGDPASFLLGVAELVRMGAAASIWVPEVAAQLERLARGGTQIGTGQIGAGGITPGAIEAAARVLHAAGEDRAVADLRKMRLPAPSAPADQMPADPALVPSWVEHRLVVSDEFAAQLMPGSFPPAWLGVDFEAHGIPIGLVSTLSFAIRWHGERPAVLWEVDGPPMPLSYGAWHTGQLAGEALWPAVTSNTPSTPSPDTSFS
jgi:hypothetical protein